MAEKSSTINQKADLIWAIADKLTGVYKPHEYGDVILPLTVIRRFDCILSDTKDAVLQKYEAVKNMPMKDILLKKASGFEFYNTSKYTFEKLISDPDNIEDNFKDYLNGFSENVRNIIEKFKFDGHIATMAEKGILYIVIKEFAGERGNLHPNEISHLEMGYFFEEIIRKFSEAHNEDAGQHYTPREVIQLMVNILFNDDNDVLSGNNVAKTIYDPACGTGGMLSVAEEYLHSLNASTELVSFGQELNDQTFAICKSDMLIKGNNADFIKNGNTLSDDQFKGQTFDYILSNPPFGREWKNEKPVIDEEAKLGFGGRFGPGLPAQGDGQLLFLLTAISKMKDISQGGSRIAIIAAVSSCLSTDSPSPAVIYAKTQRSAFAKLVQLYSEPLYWKIRQIVFNHDDANDILQNTFVKVWSNLGSFQNKSKFSTWMYRIAINESLDFLRKQKANHAISADEQEGVALKLMSDEYFDGDEIQALLKEAVATLPDVQRTVFTLRYYNEMKYSEISEILSTSEGALKASYHLAVKKITEYLHLHN